MLRHGGAGIKPVHCRYDAVKPVFRTVQSRYHIGEIEDVYHISIGIFHPFDFFPQLLKGHGSFFGNDIVGKFQLLCRHLAQQHVVLTADAVNGLLDSRKLLLYRVRLQREFEVLDSIIVEPGRLKVTDNRIDGFLEFIDIYVTGAEQTLQVEQAGNCVLHLRRQLVDEVIYLNLNIGNGIFIGNKLSPEVLLCNIINAKTVNEIGNNILCFCA